MDQATTRTSGKLQKRVKVKGDSFVLSVNLIKEFVRNLKATGRAKNTIEKYRYELGYFADWLGEDKTVHEDSLSLWRQSMLEQGYAAQTINAKVSAVNHLYDYLGRRNWQLRNYLERPERSASGLSREEYLKLLVEAKQQEKVQLYLMIKTLCCTGLLPSDFKSITREAIQSGVIKGRQETLIPDKLRGELLTYALQRGIRSGPVFVNSNNNVHDRTTVSRMIATLGEDAGLEPGKANPRNLRQLYLSTREEFQKQADAWVEECYSELLNEEEEKYGWQMWLAYI